MDDRDTFAAAALIGLLGSHGIHGSDYAPEKAYQLADAMLAERAKRVAAQSYSQSDANRGDCDTAGVAYARAMWAVFSDRSVDPQYESLCREACVEWAETASQKSDERLTVEPLYRKTTNLDAAPAARAGDSGAGDKHGSQTTQSDGSAPRDCISEPKPASECASIRRRREAMDGTYKAPEPVAWAALRDDGDVAWIGYTPEGAADGAGDRQIVPLYADPPQDRVVRLPRSIEDSDGTVGLGIGLDRVKRLLDTAGVKWEVGNE